MADIARYPLVRHLRGSSTSHVEQVRNGRTVRAGVGASVSLVHNDGAGAPGGDAPDQGGVQP